MSFLEIFLIWYLIGLCGMVISMIQCYSGRWECFTYRDLFTTIAVALLGGIVLIIVMFLCVLHVWDSMDGFLNKSVFPKKKS
jgi:uncharacterized membrane protein